MSLFLYGIIILPYFQGALAQPATTSCCATTSCNTTAQCCPPGAVCPCTCFLTQSPTGVSGRCASSNTKCKTTLTTGCTSDQECCPASATGALVNCFCYQQSPLVAGTCLATCVDCTTTTASTAKPTTTTPNPCSKVACTTDESCCDQHDCECFKRTSTADGFCLNQTALLPCPNKCPIKKKCANSVDCCKCQCVAIAGTKLKHCIPK